MYIYFICFHYGFFHVMESDTLPLQNDTFTIMKIISMFLINRDYRCLYLRDLFPFFFGINLLIAELYLESFSLVL